MAVAATDLGHEYEDLGKYSAAIPPAASGDEYEVVKCHDYDAVERGAATGPVGETIAGGDYDDVKHTEATAVPGGGTTASEAAEYSEVTGPAGGTTANGAAEYSEVTGPAGGTTASGDDFDITKCPAYAPVMGSQDPK